MCSAPATAAEFRWRLGRAKQRAVGPRSVQARALAEPALARAAAASRSRRAKPRTLRWRRARRDGSFPYARSPLSFVDALRRGACAMQTQILKLATTGT